MQALQLPVRAGGHEWELIARVPASPRVRLLWLPALGVSARNYVPLAEELAKRGVAVFLHEWRGAGSSNLRAGRGCDWGYRELLVEDIPASLDAMGKAVPSIGDTCLGGHSLGGQLATCSVALRPGSADGLWLVGSGAPYWRVFPAPLRWGLPLVYRFLPWLTRRAGALPGRRLGFGGNEARGVIHDWARSGLTGRYAAERLDVDIEGALANAAPRVRAVVLAEDWMAPRGSLEFLAGKMPDAPQDVGVLGSDVLRTRADHFSWMQQPQAVAEALLGRRGRSSQSRE